MPCIMAWVSPPWLTIFAYKEGILVESTIWERESAESVWEWSDEKKRERLCCHMQQSVWAESWVILLHVFIVTLSLSLIQWLSPVNVGDFVEPRKILCQCALASVEQLSVHPRSAHGGCRNSPTPSSELIWKTWMLDPRSKNAKWTVEIQKKSFVLVLMNVNRMHYGKDIFSTNIKLNPI